MIIFLSQNFKKRALKITFHRNDHFQYNNIQQEKYMNSKKLRKIKKPVIKEMTDEEYVLYIRKQINKAIKHPKIYNFKRYINKMIKTNSKI